MKTKFIILCLLGQFIFQNTFAQVAKKVLVEHFTNTKCSVCASRNPGFYTNLSSQTGILHLAIHPSSPYSSCLLHQQNTTANDARTNYYGVYGGTPRLVINGNVISSSQNYSSSSMFTAYQALLSPASIRIVQQKFAKDSIRSKIVIKTEATHNLGNLSLFVALAEDTVFYKGSNGEPAHYDVFRKTLNNNIGVMLTLPAAVGDSIVFTYSSATNVVWNFDRIYTIAILQESISKNLVQAERAIASEAGSTTGIFKDHNSQSLNLFPNPISTFINIPFSGTAPISVMLYNLSGDLILKKTVLVTDPILNLADLPNATYLIKIKEDARLYTQKIIKQ